MEKLQNKKRKNKFILLLIVILGILICFLLYNLWQGNKEIENRNKEIEEGNKEIETLNTEIKEQRVKILEEIDLRSDLDKLREDHQNLLYDHDIQNKDLLTKDSVINHLDSVIMQLNKEINHLLNTKKDLQQAREKIVSLQEISKKYFNQVDSLIGDLNELKLINKSLEEENKKKDKKINEQDKRLDLGSTLEIYDIDIDRIKYGRHGQERKVIIRKNIQVLRCRFMISANKVAKAESKSVYIQYISPNGKILQSSGTPAGSEFDYNGSVRQATTYSVFNYQNNEMEIEVNWQRGDILEKGKYKILFFIEGKIVAEKFFKL